VTTSPKARTRVKPTLSALLERDLTQRYALLPLTLGKESHHYYLEAAPIALGTRRSPARASNASSASGTPHWPGVPRRRRWAPRLGKLHAAACTGR
jgi:hypothetical protein